MGNEQGRWVTINGTHVFIKNGQSPMDAFIRQKGKNKKVDYKKYLEERDKTTDKYIAVGGKVDVLSEKRANELLEMGVDEELLPHAYPLRDDYPIKEAMEKDKDWLERYIEDAKKNKERNEKHWAEQLEWEKEKQKRKSIENAINKLDYDGKGSKKYKDYDTDQVGYEIDNDTLKTITNDWAYKDDTVEYFITLDDEVQEAIADYTDENAKYNYKMYNNILNEHWEQKELDELGKKRVKQIDDAINNSTIDEDMYLYRAGDIIHINDDMTMNNKGYMSTTLYKKTADFFDNVDIFKIRVPKGTKGLYIGANTMSMVQEDEVLLGRNTLIKIIGRNKDGTIECEIIKRK